MKNIDRLPFPELIDKWIQSDKKHKAQIIYRKCIESGKFSLARKISEKYNLHIGKSDAIIAFGMTLIAHRK